MRECLNQSLRLIGIVDSPVLGGATDSNDWIRPCNIPQVLNYLVRKLIRMPNL